MSIGKVTVLGVSFDSVTMDELVQFVDAAIREERRAVLAFSNPEFLMQTRSHPFLLTYLNETAAKNVADGIGIIIAAKLLGTPLKERVTGTDFVHRLVQLAHENRRKIYFLGGAPGVAERARALLSRRFGSDVIAGCSHGYFTEDNDEQIVAEVNRSGADILMVCLGNPKQEEWIVRNRGKLYPKIIFGNGGALDFWSGSVRRAPAWMQKLGFEWLYRLSQDFSAQRIKRQLKLSVFLVLVMLDVGRQLLKPRMRR